MKIAIGFKILTFMKNFGWIFSFLLFTLSIQAQNFANDCVNAIVICGNENIVSNATGFGNTQEISGCGSFEHNTIWIKINIVQAGTLGFNLIPSDPDLNVDYDFWVFGPNKNCGTTLGNPIRCNTVSPLPPPYGANLSSNVTGMNGSTLATQSGPGPGSPGSTGYVRWLDVTPGQFYYIAIDRPGGEGGFELEWIGSAMAGTGAFPTSPTANVIPDYEVCSSTPDIGIFDLDSVRSSINPDLTSNAITFYETYELAFDELDPLPNIINNTANPQTVFAKVKNNTTGCFSITSFRLVVNPIPEVTMSVSNSTICVGGNITVSFTGTPGAILQYQINSDPLISATLSTAGTFSFSQTISNTTTFSLNNVKTFDNLGDVICTQQYTNSITVTATQVPTATISYAATSFCANTTSVQNVSVTGTNAFENGTFSALPMGLLLNSTTGAITPSGSLPGDYEITYIIPASGGCDAIPVTTLVSIVLQPTLTLTSAPSTTNQTICAGSAITPIQYTLGSGATNIDFGLSGLPAGLEYSISGNLVTIFGTPSSLIPGILNYTIVVTGNSCGNPSLSGTITLTTGIQPFFNPVAAVCEGVTPSLPTLSNNFIPITGFWTQTGATSSSITYEFSPDENQCALPGTTMIVEINPRPAVIVDNLPVQNTICSGESINLLLSSLVPGAEFFWTSSNANGVSGHSDSTPGTPLTFINQTLTLNPGVTSPREVTYNIYAEANGCLGVEFPITITVNPVPNVVVKGDNPLTICSGEIIDISFEGSVSGTIFNWVVQSSTGVSGAFDGQGSAMTQQLSTTGFSQGQVVYEVTPTFNGCTGASVLVTVFVNPIPQLLGDNSNHPQLCSGVDLTSIAFSSLHPNPNTIYSWTATQVGVMGAEDGTFTGQDLVIQQLLSTTSLSQGYVDYEITPILNNCSGTPVMVRVYVNPLPNPVLTDGTICVDPSGNTFQTYTFNSGLNNDDYDFVWYFNGVAIPNSNNFTYSANAVGTYGVIATNSLTNCPSSDEANMVTAIVGITTPATGISVIQTDYFSGNATVTVTVIGGSGTFMYSLDEGALQDSNLFTNVSSGSHIVTVIDTEGCTYFTYDLFIIGYPNFFTPNGDGFNDVWQIEGLQSRDSINIFDRYGKLIKQLRGDEFWDGSYNQELLPSTDYWFMVNYQENGITKQFKGHFSLIR